MPLCKCTMDIGALPHSRNCRLSVLNEQELTAFVTNVISHKKSCWRGIFERSHECFMIVCPQKTVVSFRVQHHRFGKHMNYTNKLMGLRSMPSLHPFIICSTNTPKERARNQQKDVLSCQQKYTTAGAPARGDAMTRFPSSSRVVRTTLSSCRLCRISNFTTQVKSWFVRRRSIAAHSEEYGPCGIYRVQAWEMALNCFICFMC